jgi:hypothetical protein
MKNFYITVIVAISLGAAACGNPFYDENTDSPTDVMWIDIKQGPTKRLYHYGEALDLTGMEVTYWQRDNTKHTAPDPVVSGYNPYAEGIQYLTVTVSGKTASFAVALMAFQTSGTINASPSGSVPISSNDWQNGDWEAYLYSGTSLYNGPSLASGINHYTGSGNELSVTAPSSIGTYTLAVSLRIDRRVYYRFYNLVVS